ncbi:MAG: extracellular solute-binding protein, partial [Acidimicrobiales bacterium]
VGPLMASDHISTSAFPPIARATMTFEGKTCGLPFLGDDYGLYYNKTLFAQAGISGPPRTLSELTADAKKLTQLNGDGSIKVAGFDPLFDFYENYIVNIQPMTGAPWFDKAGKAALTDPRWTELLTWQKSLVDFYGYGKLTKFGAAAGDEFSASNPFETGKVAMAVDGEWRTGLIATEHPELAYETAPLPVADDHPELYGSSRAEPNLLAIPRGAKNPAAAWALAKYLALQTSSVVQWANHLKNVPTTNAALASPDLQLGTHFAPFLAAFSNPLSSFSTALRQGTVYYDPITNFGERWQSGKISDLQAEERTVDNQIDSLVAQG